MIAYALGFCFDFKTVFEYDIEYCDVWSDCCFLPPCDERTPKELAMKNYKLAIISLLCNIKFINIQKIYFLTRICLVY